MSIGLMSAAAHTVAGLNAVEYKTVGSLGSVFRSGGWVLDPDYGPDYNYPLTSDANFPGNITMPPVEARVFDVATQLAVGVDLIHPDGRPFSGSGPEKPFETQSFLALNYSSSLIIEGSNSTVTLPTTDLQGLKIHLNKTTGLIFTTTTSIIFSEEYHLLSLAYVFSELQMVNSTSQAIVSYDKGLEIPAGNSPNLTVRASWAVSLLGDGDQTEYYGGNEVLGSWSVVVPDDGNLSDLPIISGEFLCFYRSNSLVLPLLRPPVAEIGLVIGGVSVTALSVLHPRSKNQPLQKQTELPGHAPEGGIS